MTVSLTTFLLLALVFDLAIIGAALVAAYFVMRQVIRAVRVLTAHHRARSLAHVGASHL